MKPPVVDTGVEALRAALEADAASGQRMLVVLGSGCSVSARLPTMFRIFSWLQEQLETLLHQPAHQPLQSSIAIRALREDLNTMKSGGGSRAVAARALRLLQHAPLRDDLGPLEGTTSDPGVKAHTAATQLCADLWRRFSIAFLNGEIRLQDESTATPAQESAERASVLLGKPTAFHGFVAALVKRARAIPLSLNFDGFTRKAINQAFDSVGKSRHCVILSSSEAVRGFQCASGTSNGPTTFVIKVWGDVFHAVCHTPSCPQFRREVPLYDIAPSDFLVPHPAPSAPIGQSLNNASDLFASNLKPDSFDRYPSTEQLLQCPDCGSDRQLQIFFAGYQEKERLTEELIPSLEGFLASSIGSLLIAGFSGDWDSRLAEFLVSLSRRISVHGRRSKVFCVDAKQTHIHRMIEAQGVAVTHFQMKCDEFAEQIGPTIAFQAAPSPAMAEDRPIKLTDEAWKFWKPLLPEPREGSRYLLPMWCEAITSPVLTDTLGKVRQLGVKTSMLRAEEWPHSRLFHSVGCATLAWAWQNKLERSGNAPRIPDYPSSATMLAAALHDMGHLPFSHLAEEVFHELNWTVGSNEAFHHDSGPFNVAWNPIKDEAMRILSTVFPQQGGDVGITSITRLIEGGTGVPHLDALINSPIDVDKIDYVFRDCLMLGQAVHLPVGHLEPNGLEAESSQAERCRWFKTLMEYQLVLPSGLIAIFGLSGEKARELLEERWYLYRNVYFRPVFRAIERLARAILVLWLVRRLSQESTPATGYLERSIDSRKHAGEFGRDTLWRMLTGSAEQQTHTEWRPIEGGEAAMVEEMAAELNADSTLPKTASEWIDACKICIASLRLKRGGSPMLRSLDELERELPRYATVGQPLFVAKRDYDTALREVIRNLEYERPFVAMVDAAVMPRMLSYPPNNLGGVVSECYVVPDHNPDHWGRWPRGRWKPLSETAYALWDRERWVQLLVISPYPRDYNGIGHLEDRLKTECRRRKIPLLERMPSA